MYQLSINHQGRSVTTTDHPDHDDAHRSLISYVIAADYYLRPLSTDTDTVRYELLALADPDRRAARPQHTGHATISAVTSPIPRIMTSSPTHENGRICIAIPVRSRHTAPATPGTSSPGLLNSM